MKHNSFFVSIALILIGIFLAAPLAGCGGWLDGLSKTSSPIPHAKTPAADSPKPHHDTPTDLKPTASHLDWLIVLAVIGIGAGVGLFFIVPAEHQLSLGISGGSAAMLLVSLFTRATLWLIPWLAYGVIALLIGGVGLFIYEYFFKAAPASSPIISGNATTSSTLLGRIEAEAKAVVAKAV